MSGLTTGVIRALAEKGEQVDASSVVWLCDEIERVRTHGAHTILSWPSFTDWNVQCEIRLPGNPDVRDFEYGIKALSIAQESFAAHQRRRGQSA